MCDLRSAQKTTPQPAQPQPQPATPDEPNAESSPRVVVVVVDSEPTDSISTTDSERDVPPPPLASPRQPLHLAVHVEQATSPVLPTKPKVGPLVRFRVWKAATRKQTQGSSKIGSRMGCRVSDSFFSRPVGWRRAAALRRETLPLQVNSTTHVPIK